MELPLGVTNLCYTYLMKVILTILTISFIASAVLVGTVLYILQNQNKDATNNKQITEEQNTEVSKNEDVREVVWQQLSSEQQARVDGTWEDATVSKATLTGVMMIGVEDKTYEGKEAYMIAFPVENASIENMLALADMDTLALIGFAPVD